MATYVGLEQQGFYKPFELAQQGLQAWRQRQLEQQRMKQQNEQFGRSLAQQQAEFTGVSGGTQAQLSQAQKQFALQMPLRQQEVEATTTQAKTAADRLALEQRRYDTGELPLLGEQLKAARMGNAMTSRWFGDPQQPAGGSQDGSSAGDIYRAKTGGAAMPTPAAAAGGASSAGGPVTGNLAQPARTVSPPEVSTGVPVDWDRVPSFESLLTPDQFMTPTPSLGADGKASMSMRRVPVDPRPKLVMYAGTPHTAVWNGERQQWEVTPNSAAEKQRVLAANVREALKQTSELERTVQDYGNQERGPSLFNPLSWGASRSPRANSGFTSAEAAAALKRDPLNIATVIAQLQTGGVPPEGKSNQDAEAMFPRGTFVGNDETLAGIRGAREILLMKGREQGVFAPLPAGQTAESLAAEARAAIAAGKDPRAVEERLFKFGITL